MADPRSPIISTALESLLGFWAEAGVDCAYASEPVDRLAEGARRLAPRPQPGAGPRATLAPPAPPAPLIGDAVRAARAAAATAADLTALAAAIAAFDGCALKAGATNTVTWRGRVDAPVMIVGEGPGAQEDRQGLPFVGPSGQLLDRMLGAGGLTDQVLITNTVFWRAPANRTPSPQEQSLCLPFLERAIALVRPRILLLMGGASAKFLLKRSEGILSLRGQWADWVSEDGEMTLPALPTLHPAFLLRQPAAKQHAWRDILTLMSRLEPPAQLGHDP